MHFLGGGGGGYKQTDLPKIRAPIKKTHNFSTNWDI